MYRSAWKIVTVTDSFKDRLVQKNGIKADKIGVVKNGANLELFQPSAKNLELIKKHSLEGKK